MDEFEGIILSCNKYKEFDGVLNILTKNGIITVLGRSIFKEENKNHMFCNKFIRANFDVYNGKTNGYKLRTAKVLFYYPLYINNFLIFTIYDYLSELINKTIENGDFTFLYNKLIFCLDNLINSDNPYIDASYFTSFLIQTLGIKPNFESFNSEADICYLDYDSGTISNTNSNKSSKAFSVKEAQALQSLFVGDSIKSLNVNWQLILLVLIEHIEYSYNIKINSKMLLFAR